MRECVLNYHFIYPALFDNMNQNGGAGPTIHHSHKQHPILGAQTHLPPLYYFQRRTRSSVLCQLELVDFYGWVIRKNIKKERDGEKKRNHLPTYIIDPVIGSVHIPLAGSNL